MTNDLRWMLSSDQQFPYQDDKMIKLWFEVMKWFKPDVVDYAGDTDDMACYSKYTDGLPAEFLKMHKDAQMTQLDTKVSTNQDAQVIPIILMSNLVVSNRSLQGVLKA